MSLKTTTTLALLSLPTAWADAPQCKPFKAIYDNGKDLCETMWGSSFVYEPDESKGYSMWFFDKTNPNDQVSATLAREGRFTASLPVNKCHLEYFHKADGESLNNTDHPTEEPSLFRECHPWADRSCCKHDTVSSAQQLNEAYGEGWHWDRCGTLSPACERFFVQEACFYECEPNVGIFRQFPGGPEDPNPHNQSLYDPACDRDPLPQSCPESHNSWAVYRMPIKASYCDAWFRACSEDLFCAEADGNFFGCAARFDEDLKAKDKAAYDAAHPLPSDTKVAFEWVVVSTAVAMLLLLLVAALVVRERKGKPVFAPLLKNSGNSEAELEAFKA